MKKVIVLMVIVLAGFKINAQDQIFKINGEVSNVKIMKVSPTSIDFYYTGDESILQQEYKSNLIKIVYSSGREEICIKVKNYPKINGKQDWELVEVIEDKQNISGLIEVKRLSATSGWGNAMAEKGIRNCIEDLQKQSAKLGCPVLLVTNKSKGFSTSAEGIAYKVNDNLLKTINNSSTNSSNNQNTNKSNSYSNQTQNNYSNNKIDVDIDIPVNSVVNENYFALIIGNENYYKEIKVPYAINDATAFYEYSTKTLGIPIKQVHLLKDVTYGQFLAEIEWLENILKVYKNDARIFIYYAGHGFPDEGTKSTYILPVDGKSSTVGSAIKLETIYAKFGAYSPKNITFFLDACFSGAARDGMLAEGRGVKIKPKDDILNGKIVVFSATTGDETAHPLKEKQHGTFTYFLLKKIQETKGNITYFDLYQYIKENVSKISVIENRMQNPVVNTSEQIKDDWKNWIIK